MKISVFGDFVPIERGVKSVSNGSAIADEIIMIFFLRSSIPHL